MRFTKGCKVEVFSKREVPTGSWRPAEIISGDGNNYTVKYDKFAYEQVIGWVSREAIRPRPPLVATTWISGDFVEVFDNFSWKVGKFLKGLGKKQILVELHGSLVNLLVNLDDIRVRHSWEDGKWTVIRKALKYEDGNYYETLTGFANKWGKSTTYKATEWEYSAGPSRKYRNLEKEGQTYRAMENLSGEYVMPSQCHMNGTNHGRSSMKIRFPVIAPRSEPNHQFFDSFTSVRSDSNDEDSDMCSIGSCSTSDSWTPFIHSYPTAYRDSDVSDAESSCAPSYGKLYIATESPEKSSASRIHQLELGGYRYTLRTLHSAGPLSWEQQSLISNLRLSLNISNDEHLIELKSLLSR